MDRGVWQATIHGVARVRHDLGTKTTIRGKRGLKSSMTERYLVCGWGANRGRVDFRERKGLSTG